MRQGTNNVDIRYIIGVDGGGTGTRARLATLDGVVLGTGEAGPSALGQGIDQAWSHVLQAAAQAFQHAGLVPAAPGECAMGLGLSGVHVPSRREAFLRAAPRFAQLALDDDGATTLFGAHRGQPGAVVAAGTGSIGEALRRDGRRVTVSGWGFGIGDEGSGAWLGQRAVQRAHHALDGRAPAGALARAVWSQAGATRDAMLAWGEQAGQAAYAQLAPLVFECEAADPAAAALIAEAVAALSQVAQALDPEAALPMVVTGSVGQRLQPRFAPALLARCVEAAGDSADGALHLIRRALVEAAR
jgi:glucosamine kinase